jgi:hypothetical protein
MALMNVRAGLLLFAAATACKGRSEPAPKTQPPATPASDAGTAMADARASATSTIAALQRLGIDGPDAPKTIDATVRFAVITTRYDDKRADMVEELAIHRIEGGALKTESTTPLPAGVELLESVVWRSPTELVLLTSDEKIWAHKDGAFTSLAMPASSLFKIKPRGKDLSALERNEGLIATATGDVWLDHCAWGYEGDDDPCTDHVYVRVTGKPTASRTPPAPRPAPGKLAAPTGWAFRVHPQPDHKTGVLECTSPDHTSTKLPVPADSFGFSIDDAEWLSQRPPIQRVHVWYGGLDDAVASDRLLAGCTLSDLEPGVVRGPNGYWTVRPGGDSTMVLLWHGRVVTTLTDVDELAFAP